jgi:hypothetical protein
MKWKEKRANSLIDRDPKTNVKELPKKPNHTRKTKRKDAKSWGSRRNNGMPNHSSWSKLTPIIYLFLNYF